MKPLIFRKSIVCFSIVFSIKISTPENLVAQFPVFEALAMNEIDLPNIPSASGIVKMKDAFFVVGDDSPFLFQLNPKFQLTNKIQIYSTKNLLDGRLMKKDKPDFESIAIAPWGKDKDLLVFGSGSGPEKRNVLIRIDFDGEDESVTSYPLKKFYRCLAEKTGNDGNLNIEGAGFWEDYLLLLDRSENTLFKIDFEDFKDYVKDKDKDKPKIETIQFNLPEINGIQARFSGMSVLKEEDMIVFAASVENDPNWVSNEKIIGSYLGIIDLNQLENNKPVCKPIKKNNKPIHDKVESVQIIAYNEKTIQLVGVVDNDNGTSKLIEIEFQKTGK